MNFLKFHKVLLSAILLSLLAFPILPQASASFSSMYVFGDGVSATNDPTTPVSDPLLYGRRNCNGRVWVEVLWQWQGHAFDDAKNRSSFGNISEDVVADTVSFTPPGDVGTAMFVIWCANADFVEFFYTGSTAWTSFINDSISRHVQAVTNLYNKGARTFVMPNAVDIMATPNYNDFDPSEKAFVRQKVIEFNTAFKTAMEELSSSPSKPGLKIHLPDTFTFFEQVRANPVAYGLIDPIPWNAGSFDAPSPSLNGNGSNYIFWDDYHPTAKFQMHLAAFFQELVFPPKVRSVSVSGGNAQLQVADIPLGRAGIVQGSSNLQPPWTQDTTFTVPFVIGGSTTSTVSVPISGPQRFYRVGFPVVWTWP